MSFLSSLCIHMHIFNLMQYSQLYVLVFNVFKLTPPLFGVIVSSMALCLCLSYCSLLCVPVILVTTLQYRISFLCIKEALN